jgi:NodT family efflux transporter outer membrane factor (OMF) lipoprotein
MKRTLNTPWADRNWTLLGVLFLAVAAFGGLTLAGCAPVGPDYVRPKPSAPDSWRGSGRGGLETGRADPETLARWWTTLEDPALSALIIQGLRGNLDLREARARVREARARRGLSEAGLFPTLNASGSALHIRTSENSNTGREYKLFAVGFDAAWELDVFGGLRRSIEAAEADLEASSEDSRDVMVSLLAEVALNYIEIRTFQTRLRVAAENITAQEETLELARSRFEAGLIAELAVQQARYNLENTRSQVPTLRTGLEAAQNRLAVLLGEPPGTLHAELAEPGPIPVPPAAVAVGIPADTLRNRPDVRRAERLLAAQTARIGEATGELYPRFTLNGSIGLESTREGRLFEKASRTWNVGPAVTWNLFDAGAIRRNIEIQSALQEQYLIRYESAVLAALEEVENAMTAYAEEQLRRESLASAVEAARLAALLAREQYTAGLVDFTSVLDAERSQLSFQDELARSEGAVTTNLVRLYKALGGGWDFLMEASPGTRPGAAGNESDLQRP